MRFLSIFSAIIFFSITQLFSQNSPIQINNGFGKCAAIGQSGSNALWYRDNFYVDNLISANNQIYAWISYNTTSSIDTNGVSIPEWNAMSCSRGLFQYNSVLNKWIRKTNAYTSPYFYTILTNGKDIIGIANYGNIYLYDSTATNGWKLTTPLSFKEKMFFKKTGSTTTSLDWRDIKKIEFIKDTLFCLIISDTTSEQGIIKLNYKNNSITFDSIGAFPGDMLKKKIPSEWNGNFDNYFFTDNIAGKYNLFASYRDAMSKDSCFNKGFYHGEKETVRVLWAWDKINKKWFNISQGPDWRNVTLSNCAGDFQFVTDKDQKRLFIINQQAIYEWLGNSYRYIAANNATITSSFIVKSPKIEDDLLFYLFRKDGIKIFSNYTKEKMITSPLFSCSYNTVKKSVISSDGNTIFFSMNGFKYPSKCDWSSNSTTNLGIYKVNIDPTIFETTTNLHLEAATYIGGNTGENTPIGGGIGANNSIFVAGNFSSPLIGKFKTGWTTHNYNGATPTSKGKIVQLNKTGDSTLSLTNLGNTITDFDIQNFGSSKMVAAGDFGVTVLDSSGKNLIYSKSNTAAPLNTYGSTTSDIRVDIDDLGHVAVLKSQTNFTVPGSILNVATFFVFDQNGNQVGTSKYIGSGEFSSYGGVFSNWHIQDIAIHKDTIYITGFCQDNLNGNFVDNVCDGDRFPIQSAFILAYRWNGSAWNRIWKTWGFEGDSLGRDVSDTRGYHLNIGKDNKLYYLGVSIGGASVYRWNGKDCQCCNGSSDQPKTVTLTTFDLYNTYVNIKGGSINAYFSSIDKKTGIVEKGMLIIPRMTDGSNNTFQVLNGSIQADENGNVFVGGTSNYAIQNRDLTYINGNLLGKYAGGDMSLHVVNSDFTVRTFWGAFNKDDSATGTIVAIGLKDGKACIIGDTKTGKLFTGATRNNQFKEEWAMNADPFNYGGKKSGLNTISDTYVALFKSDVLEDAYEDELETIEYESQSVINDSCIKSRPDFTISDSIYSICINQNLTIEDNSKGAKEWTWDFGDGANLLPGTKGKGPWIVSYSTSGYKTIKLTIQDICNNIQVIERKDILFVSSNSVSLLPIQSPSSVCEGNKLVISTPKVDGISKYNWTLPAGSLILNGNGTNEIDVQIGISSGTIKVVGENSCNGITPTVSKALLVLPTDSKRLLLVAGKEKPLLLADSLLKTKLLSMGYNIWLKDDNDIVESDEQCVSSIIISSTVNSTIVGNKFVDAAKSIIIMNPDLYTNYYLSNGKKGLDYGKQKTKQLAVTNNTHELGKGIVLGVNDLYSTADSINWGIPFANPIIIASIAGEATKKTIYAYEKESNYFKVSSDSISAAGRRIAFFMNDSATSKWNASAQKLFENAICWANYNCATLNTIIVSDSIKKTLCYSEQVNVVFTASGTFTNGNKYCVQLSNSFGSFANATNIGEIKSSATGQHIISCIIPENIINGNGYKIRVISTLPSLISNSTSTITINGKLQMTCQYSVVHDNCKDQYLITIDPVLGATEYDWEIPLGCRFINPNEPLKFMLTTGNSIIIELGSSTEAIVYVNARNQCGVSEKCTIIISPIHIMIPPIPIITGDSIVKQSDTVIYKINGLVKNYHLSNYWNIPSEIIVLSTDTINHTITLSFKNAQNNTKYTITNTVNKICLGQDIISKEITVDNLVGQVAVTNLTQNTFSISPNPIEESAEIEFNLENDSKVTLNLFNSQGVKLNVLLSANLLRGKHSLLFNKKQLETGIYFIQIVSDNYTDELSIVIK